MLRDTRKDTGYFIKYIEEQEQRVREFTSRLRALDEEKDKDNARLIRNTAISASSRIRDLFIAEYSFGCSVAVLKDIFRQHLQVVRRLDSLSFADAMYILSISILLDEDCAKTIEDVSMPEDCLIAELEYYVKNKRISPDALSLPLQFPDKSEVFLNAIRGKITEKNLRTFISEEWYSTNQDMGWYDSHKNNLDTYCGYWCFIGAAIVKIKGWKKEIFESVEYFPYDLL